MSLLQKINIKPFFTDRLKGDAIIWAIVIVLALISLIAIYSSTGSLAYRMKDGHAEVYLLKRLFIVAIGLLIMFVAHNINYTLYKKYAFVALMVGIALLLYTIISGGVNLNNASRWIAVPIVNVTFQASDFAKLALFVFLAAQLSKMQSVQGDFKKIVLRIFLPVGIVCLLIARDNMSTALLIGVSCGIMFFIGRIQWKYIFGLIGVLVLVVGLAVMFSPRATTWKNRLTNFAGGENTEVSYQTMQSKIAIAKGGLVGKGPGSSTQRNFLPHSYSDFIYSIIIEEYGLIIGGMGMIFLYLLFLWRSIIIFRKCPYAFGSFLAVGLSFSLVFQAFVNMAVNVNLLPVTGLTLPLVSKGGSSVWFTCLTIGIILSVSKFVEENHKNKTPKQVQGNMY
jgi:cell division protein FtsW